MTPLGFFVTHCDAEAVEEHIKTEMADGLVLMITTLDGTRLAFHHWYAEAIPTLYEMGINFVPAWENCDYIVCCEPHLLPKRFRRKHILSYLDGKGDGSLGVHIRPAKNGLSYLEITYYPKELSPRFYWNDYDSDLIDQHPYPITTLRQAA